MTTTARATLDREMSEAALDLAVTSYAIRQGWATAHVRDSRGQEWTGLPDRLFCRPDRLVWVELKTVRGRVGPAQREWIDLLRMAGQEVHVWRPHDWSNGTIEEVLR